MKISLRLLSFVAAISLSSQSNAELIAWWDFNDAPTTGVTVDQRGGQPAQILSGAVITPDTEGKSGLAGDKAARFGATNQYMQVVSDYFATSFGANEVTVTFWIKHAVLKQTTPVSFVSGANGRAFQAHGPWSDGRVYFDTGNSITGTGRIFAGMGAVAGTWHHVALVRGPAVGSTNKQVYIDGTLLVDGTNDAQIGTNVTKLVFGNQPDLNASVNGDMDDLAVFSRELTATEIGDLYTGTKTPGDLATAVTDSDTDGLPDMWENFHGTLGDFAAAPADSDGDGLTDVDELARGTNPTVQDTDGDGLFDNVETGTGTWDSLTDRGTNALDVDSDGDGLSDGVESNSGTFVDAADTGTNPNLTDTDGDRATDSHELIYGSNPVDVASTPVLLALWDFNNSSNANIATDVRGGNVVNRAGGAAYTADEGGKSGLPGDRAASTTGGNWNAAASDWMNVGPKMDKLTVMFWQKNTTTPASSSFWLRSASAAGVRGMQVHLPWSGNTIYYDHMGATGSTQRLQGGPPAGHDWTQWHHYAFVKAGGVKQLYIDGVVHVPTFDQSSGAAAFVDDFTNIYIGSNDLAQNSMDGLIDDFAIFADELSASAIAAVANGTKTVLEVEDIDADGLPDSWEYQFFPADLTQLGGGDFDNDDLDDEDEYAAGTDPTDDDSDDDLLLDGVEDGGGVWLSVTMRGTDPLNADSDGDRLLDGQENNSMTYVSATDPGTDPNKFDTDNDGFNDFVEGPNGYDPNDILEFPVFKDGKYLMAYWKFDDATSPTADEVNGTTGVVTGTFSAEGGGATQTGTDRAMCFAAGQSVLADGTFANLASVENKITISFWQNITAVGGSAFWVESQSAGSGSGNRGIQAHSPHTSGIVYFDHSGCCTIGQTRINSGDLRTGTGTGEVILNQWQHFAYIKDGDEKSVYIDGNLVLNGFGTAPLVDDFADLYIGSTNAGDSMSGCIDEFSLFAGALSPFQIGLLADGTETPDTVLDASSIYETWKATTGLTAGVDDGPTQNPDGDELNNLLEFAFGTDPMDNDNSPLEVTDGSNFTVGTQIVDITSPFSPANVTGQFVRRTDAAAAGLTYIPEFSADLTTWETDGSNPSPTGVSTQTAGVYEVVEVPYLVFLSNGQKASFFRIRVNSAESGETNP